MAISVDALKKVQENLLKSLPGLDEEDALDDSLLEAASKMSTDGTKYTKPDVRFPNTNMSQNCWTSLNEWQMCVNKFGGASSKECFQRYRDWKTVCPGFWVEAYAETAASGKYMGVENPVFEMSE